MVTMLVVSGVIPLTVLIALNTRIYVAIRTRSQRLATMTSRQKRFVQKKVRDVTTKKVKKEVRDVTTKKVRSKKFG